MTPIAAPMVHDTLPIVKVKSYLNKNQLPIIVELPYLRFPGIQKIKEINSCLTGLLTRI